MSNPSENRFLGGTHADVTAYLNNTSDNPTPPPPAPPAVPDETSRHPMTDGAIIDMINGQ